MAEVKKRKKGGRSRSEKRSSRDDDGGGGGTSSSSQKTSGGGDDDGPSKVTGSTNQKKGGKGERAGKWKENFVLLKAFHAEEGHARVPLTHEVGEVKLGRWLRAVQKAWDGGKLPEDKAAQLEVGAAPPGTGEERAARAHPLCEDLCFMALSPFLMRLLPAPPPPVASTLLGAGGAKVATGQGRQGRQRAQEPRG